MGKLLSITIVSMAFLAGILLYYLQVYHFYETLTPNGVDDVQLTRLEGDTPEAIIYDDFQAIDADSSPIRYRACFTTPLDHTALSETYAPYEGAVPLNAPRWFDCFDAAALGAALEAGTAWAFVGQRDIRYGIDRIVAITQDGRGYVWHQINRCGEIVFAGDPVPDDCAPPPSGT